MLPPKEPRQQVIKTCRPNKEWKLVWGPQFWGAGQAVCLSYFKVQNSEIHRNAARRQGYFFLQQGFFISIDPLKNIGKFLAMVESGIISLYTIWYTRNCTNIIRYTNTGRLGNIHTLYKDWYRMKSGISGHAWCTVRLMRVSAWRWELISSCRCRWFAFWKSLWHDWEILGIDQGTNWRLDLLRHVENV